MGGVVDAVGGLFGVGGSESVTPLQYRPFDVSSALGQASVDGRQVNARLSPELQRIYSGLLGQVPQQFQTAATPEASLGFLSRAFAPQFERQQLSQESRLFNQGLLGSTTGQLQTQALREAQNQALVQNALSAQQQAFQRGQGLLGSALQVGAAPLGLAQLGGGFGEAELRAQEGTAGLRQQAEANQANLFSGLVGAGASLLGSRMIAGAVSDIRLKKNIKSLGNGLYSWEWNDKALELDADRFPTIGVIAQEIMETHPEAVFRGDHGYLMVDYSKVA